MTGQVALVTGADGARGIGQATCRALAARGADVAFTVRPGTRDHEALELELHAHGTRVLAVKADLSEPGAARAVLDAVCAHMALPSILVNNAAHSAPDGFGMLDARVLDDHYAVNLRTPALLSCELARRHPAGTPGRIVNLTSGQFLGPMPGELAYAATKGALEAFTVQLAAEVAALGITVNAIGPGPTDTGWMGESLKLDLRRRFPMGRLGQPEDAARLIAFLCSEEAGWITGQVIHSEGGFVRS